ncbi:hypothetical protein A2875_05585 [Candidatus Gottesmanbacteria bacterium RIFCSPHIGHO2_01_FULL_46_14]|uniref:Uncharacterized protein n=2 Tax=Candidatus Gottesmaniibacteriota TaxID=1752720 RepID=A0A1F5ZL36_9BACT|nr:MAG: hypothetical protein A2875_05585 [Candidatus Gottesmanbacteria bacterium RIFCSPHIGHO2_01_FULL_46_14]OGG28644.1 MAG: hypothetical protein A2971_05300 [Candidatus Gottesmanbacteria bacterium RIFCSPLOWO2_01_FULL_46_21]
MHRSVAKLRGLGFIIWHARHEFYHIGLGLLWAWFLRERWNEFNSRWIFLSIVGSLLPDTDHVLYFFSWGKRESYSQQVLKYLRTKQWRNLTVFLQNGHKNQTNLASHNYYFMAILLGSALASSLYEWRVGIILFGAMFVHYIFDIADDVFMLGAINPNWRRWGREKPR